MIISRLWLLDHKKPWSATGFQTIIVSRVDAYHLHHLAIAVYGSAFHNNSGISLMIVVGVNHAATDERQ
jgi:hypothetical protein